MAEAVKAKITYGLMYVLSANFRLELMLKSVIDIPSVRRSSGKMNEKITILIAGGISGTDPAIRIRTDIPLQMPVQAGVVVLLIFAVFIFSCIMITYIGLRETGIMGKLFSDKRYSGIIWHFIFAVPFIVISLLFLKVLEGPAWHLTSTALRIVFGTGILIAASRLYGRKISEILSFRNSSQALIAGTGIIMFFVYYVTASVSGFGGLSGLTTTVFVTKVILQQAATGFYEELNYRFLLLEGVNYTKNTMGMKIIYILISSVLFGALHCIPTWDTYEFLRTGAMGFAFAVIFVKTGNIVIPMIIHFVYDIAANLTKFVTWENNPVFDNLTAVFDVMLVVMVVTSAVILVAYKPKLSVKT